MDPKIIYWRCKHEDTVANTRSLSVVEEVVAWVESSHADRACVPHLHEADEYSPHALEVDAFVTIEHEHLRACFEGRTRNRPVTSR